MSVAAINAAAPILGGLFNLVDSLFTTQEEKMAAKLKLLELQQKGELAQIGVNLQEAKSANLFVAGWRPFIGWTCGVAFAYTFVLYPMIQSVVYGLAAYNGTSVDPNIFPTFSLNEMMPVLLGMLGLGAMRSFEKNAGVAREQWNVSSDGVDRRAK